MMSTKDFSNLQENMIAKALGWNVVSGSGARPLHPGDVISSEFLGECKTHEHPGNKIVFNSSVWHKIKDEALSKFKHAVLFTDDGSQSLEHTWCLVDYIRNSDNIYPFPKNIRKNVIFSEKDLDIGKIYSVSLSNINGFICNFELFRDMMLGD